jgi:hypothetical protein
MFCTPGCVFGGTECVRSRFHVLFSHTSFGRYRGRRVPSSCFALPDSFSGVSRASGPVFMFCAPRLIFDGTKGVGSRFHVLRSRPSFRRYRGRRILLSCFAVPRGSCPVFLFCAPGLNFGSTEGVESRFHVLRSRTRFRRYRGRLVPFSCFALPDSFSAVPRASLPVFTFCAPKLVFDGTEGVGSRFHVLRSRTRFRWNRGVGSCFYCFARTYSFSAFSGASGPVFLFCAPKPVFGGNEGVGPIFVFCPPGLIFDGTEGIRSCFYVLRAHTRFQWYRECLVMFSSFARPDSFSAVPRASGPVFMSCAPRLIFVGTVGVGSRFHVLRTLTHFWRYRGRQVPFSLFALPDSFSTEPRRRVPFYCFARPDSFSVLPGFRVPFSCFARPNPFSVVLRALCPVFVFCAPRIIFGGTEDVGFRFHVMRSRTGFRRYQGVGSLFHVFRSRTYFRRY